MHPPDPLSGNLRTGPARKRSIVRALRHFFLWGWVRYRGQLIQHESRLAAFFPKETVASVRAVLGSRRKWWYQQDPLLNHRRNDHQVHLPRLDGRAAPPTQNLLKLVSFNCKSLGHSNARLVEISEDLHAKGVQVAALQGTCWKHDQQRSEWTVKSRTGEPLFHCFSWSRSARVVQTGVLLLLSCSFFATEHIRERFDPDQACNTGRIGGVRVVNRKSAQPHDHMFLVAYAPQESSPEEEKQHFFTQLQQTISIQPRRTSIWLLGDFNAHIGQELWSRAVARSQPEQSNDNGHSLSQVCVAQRLALVNAFHPAGRAWWSPDGRASHRLDYVAVLDHYLGRVKRCRVNKVLGRRWQMSAVPDHFPVEVHVQLFSRWPQQPQRRAPFRWNQHAVLGAGEDPSLFVPFLTEVCQALTDLGNLPWDNLQTRWTTCSKTLFEVAQRHFGMPDTQTNSRLLPQTFDLLERRREAMHLFLQSVARKHEAPLRCQERWQLQLVFLALRLNARQESARRAVKNDVQAWKTNLVQKLQQAHQAHDSREAWSISRQLAGRLYKRPRQPPKAQPITKQDWLQHFQAVQRASECSSSAAHPACLDNSCLPGSFPSLFQGEFGQQALATAAGRLQKARATPRGALPVEVWCLLLQGREHLQPGKQLMPLFELLQSMGVNFSEWCVGHGCPIPKPGGDAARTSWDSANRGLPQGGNKESSEGAIEVASATGQNAGARAEITRARE